MNCIFTDGLTQLDRSAISNPVAEFVPKYMSTHTLQSMYKVYTGTREEDWIWNILSEQLYFY